MSNHNNYMDKVPVKISEKFKPPPRLYQLPQVICNKLQLPDNYYNESPQYNYDFQLEHKVLAKMSEWRRMRQQAREARRERKEQWEQERLLRIEAKNKQMLGAVSYPSTDDLSSSSESDSLDERRKLPSPDEGGRAVEPSAGCDEIGAVNAHGRKAHTTFSAQMNSFHNILQPTIVSTNSKSNDEQLYLTNSVQNDVQILGKTGKITTKKEVHVFNYKDFEEDTSSPFDNIELKTINDLDILAQVLHNTQLPNRQKTTDYDDNNEVIADSITSEPKSKDNDTHIEKKDENSKTRKYDTPVTAALQNVDFEKFDRTNWHNENIPTEQQSRNNIAAISNSSITQQPLYYAGEINNMNTPQFALYATYTNKQCTQHQQPQPMQQYYQMANYNGMGELQQRQHQQHQLPQHYNNLNVHTSQDQTTTQYAANHNYLQQQSQQQTGITNYSNTIAAYCSPRHLQQQQHTAATINSNSYVDPKLASVAANNFAEIDTNKSKSVPDILRELSDEVRNSEIRRSRYYSFNSEAEENGKRSADDHEVRGDEDRTPKQSPVKVASLVSDTNYYANLPPSAQRLAKNISSMGFPLERVAKISQIFGTDDKKIIEHLIPLSELMDLGFDESKISDALLQFDNNKDKALDYLIS